MSIELSRHRRNAETIRPKTGPKYAENVCFDKLVWVFYAGCLIGYLWEVVLARIQTGHFESRAGVIYGPLNPIYGFGFVVIVLCLYKIKNPWLMLLVGSLAGGGFEYLMWFLQKLILNATSWNYHSPFMVNGQVIFEWLYWGGTSFFHALGWGMLGFVAMRVIYPHLSVAVEEIPYKTGKILTWVLVTFMIFDCVVTSVALLRQAVRHACSHSGTCGRPNGFERLIDRLYSDEFLERVFPNMDLKGRIGGQL